MAATTRFALLIVPHGLVKSRLVASPCNVTRPGRIMQLGIRWQVRNEHRLALDHGGAGFGNSGRVRHALVASRSRRRAGRGAERITAMGVCDWFTFRGTGGPA